MKLLTNLVESRIELLTEGSGENKKTFLEGVFMQAEKPNRNGRIYRKQVLEAAVNRYYTEQVKTGRAVGELGHPEGPTVNLDKVSHRITELKWDGNNVVGKALILDTPMGNIVKGLVSGGVQLGVSSRGMGSLERAGDHMVVKDDFILSTVDIVQDPSAPDAYVNNITESVEWILENGVWLKRDIEKSETEIKRALESKRLTEAQLKVFAGILSKL
jgi:hypothetical protein